MSQHDFTFEMYADIEHLRRELRDQLSREAQDRLEVLAEGHSDMVGASVALERLAHGASPHLYQARVIVYTRPEDIVAVEKAELLTAALKDALSAVERQVREKRERLGKRYHKP
jgi:ribosome-associated translation inhibitor RaiA